MSAQGLFFIGMACAIFASLAWIFYKLYKAADQRATEYQKELEQKNNEIKNLQDQASAYAEEKRKNEQKLSEAASHSRPGFNNSIELMQQLHESGTGRNN